MFLRSLLVLAILGLAHGDPFTSRDELKTVVDNCLAVDPTGVSCCELIEGCGPAGTTEMPGWDVILVTDLSELFKGETAFNADITGWIVEAPNTTDMFYGASAWLSQYMNCGYDASDTTICSGSFSGSERPHDGPPNAWVKFPDGCARPRAKKSLSAGAIVGILVACVFSFIFVVKLRFFDLLWAAEHGHQAVVKVLIAACADVKKTDNDGRTPLWVAAEHDHEAVVKVLIAAGADKNKTNNVGRTPLWVAACHGHQAVVKVLIAAGADVKKTDNDGRTPLWVAACYGHQAVVKVLIAAGTDKNKVDNVGRTPLWVAAEHGREAVVKVLIAAGADVNKADNVGDSPLWVAVCHRHEAVVKVLIAAGADVKKADNDRFTPMLSLNLSRYIYLALLQEGQL